MKIAEGIYMLKLSLTMTGGRTNIYPSLIVDSHRVVLIDTGFDTQEVIDQLSQELGAIGIDMSKITDIIITHQDRDHIGGLPYFLKNNEKISLWFHEEERPYLFGEKSIEGKPSSPQIHSLLEGILADPNSPHIIHILKDNDTIPLLGGLKVVHLPGHTPGNICLYHEDSKTLVAGDSLNVFNGELSGPNPIFTPKLKQATHSLTKLLPLDIKNIITYHGGLYSVNEKNSLRKLIEKEVD